MKPEAEFFYQHYPQVDAGLIREHLSRLEERYFQTFSGAQIAGHLQQLSRLSPESPVQILLRHSELGRVECTVLAFDYPGEFSAIAGILAASGFEILSGDVFTYSRAEPGDSPRYTGTFRGRRRGRDRVANTLGRRRIIDHLNGTLDRSVNIEDWERRIRKRLLQVIRLLERGDAVSLTRAKQMVNEQVAKRLTALKLKARNVLFPVQIEVDNSASRTSLKVVSQDTPFFLYALSTALSLRGISIESVRIRTLDNRIEDVFSFLDSQGRKILEPGLIDQIKLSVLLTKQFTYFLGSAPNPSTALQRFERLVEEIVALSGQPHRQQGQPDKQQGQPHRQLAPPNTPPTRTRWVELLSNPLILKDLARLLGASDYLWEDFIRLQYETLLPMMEPHVRGQSFSEAAETLQDRLHEAVNGVRGQGRAVQEAVLNEFKDREIFHLELDHILAPEPDFQKLSKGLTRLAEVVVGEATFIVEQHLLARHGAPKTVAGLDARHAVFGLGKLGGGELGYASDIELLFLFSDAGQTEGPKSISNTEYFNHLAGETSLLIRAKKEGIFQVDLRLRPYGASGPKACSLDSFCGYFSSEAHSLERLALIRLRAIAGDPELGARVERIRDELIYSARSVKLDELRSARQKQLRRWSKPGQLNAKFSPGALLDLESTVFLLQVLFDRPSLRTPRIREAIEQLEAAEILSAQETERIRNAYHFFRGLINALRMLRGSAQDLFLPQLESDEYLHLARRMGYGSDQDLSPAQALHTEFETHTASIRVFVENHLGRESLPGPATGNMADLVLSDKMPSDLREKILKNSGFKNIERAYTNLRKLAQKRPNDFARLSVIAADILKLKPDPDMALNNWERFFHALDDADRHVHLLLAQPRRLEIMLSIFAGSQFLSDTLIRYPDFFEWTTLPEHLHRVRGLKEMKLVFQETVPEIGRGAWLNRLRRLRRREILRIGIRDICLGISIEEIMLELSTLAQAVIQISLEHSWKTLSGDLCILALGKLGGGELNYSSDIDLLGITRDRVSPEESFEYARVLESLQMDLSTHLEEGYAYRVDFRLRPHGESGYLVHSISETLRYYSEEAQIWEVQSLLKATPVAGNLDLGQRFKEGLVPILSRGCSRPDMFRSLQNLRRARHRKLARGVLSGVNIKLSGGGIRDIEFLTQGLQLIHSRPGDTALLSGNTLEALDQLCRAAVLPDAAAAQLKRDYRFLRRIEHYLQIFEDRQTHTLPKDPLQLESLARRILGLEATTAQFLEQVRACMTRVENVYTELLA